ncbi:hypothetical protein MC7420_6602 [Coleofasciculus chthonoplastes PCC 7420]|uniref:Uncharacterized protein n=1 Tax=Coleofasciculus chthonoplastes PCC 7420 TaxID=118168 RepID=B4W426_9CYAN|nr:hypothetical protein MC7420_6602 [Coleofasciculus chthonoplastes PCC 7420]
MICNVNQQLITEDITLYSLPDDLEDLVSILVGITDRES